MSPSSRGDAGWTLRWPAPAKLNLFLHVLGRRPDGYHRLQTVFQFLDWGDALHFSPRDDGRLVREGGMAGIPAEQDLVIRAAAALREAAGIGHGVTIRLDKHVPAGAGLGGGSSDAATVLVALNRLWNTGLDDHALATLGLKLGADVPVFVRGRSAWAEGVGEELTPVDLPEPWYAILVPAVTVPTAAVFAAPELRRNTAPITFADFLSGAGHNDCTPVTTARFPPVAAVLAHLGRFGPARMSGTGGAVFLPRDSEASAHAAIAEAPDGMRAVVARGRNRSPLQVAQETLRNDAARL